MSVLSCKLRPEGQSVTEDGSCTESWLIKVSSKLDHPLLFAGALQLDGYLPVRGGGHWHNPFLRSTGLKISRVGLSMFHWIASTEYKLLLSEKEEEEIQREQEPNPLARKPIITKSYERAEVVVEEDKDGNAILNAAGDPWLEPVLSPRSFPVWNVTCNVADSPAWMDTLAGKSNSNTVVIRGRSYTAGQLLFEPDGESELKQENGISFYEVSFRLLVDTVNNWKEKRVENGLNEISAEGVKRKIKLPIRDDEGNPLAYDDEAREPVSDPQLIDADGKLIEDPSSATAISVEIDKIERESFESLPNLNV